MQHSKILILDFGSQVTQLIARRVRECGVFCEILPCDVEPQRIKDYGASGIILSGSHHSRHLQHYAAQLIWPLVIRSAESIVCPGLKSAVSIPLVYGAAGVILR